MGSANYQFFLFCRKRYLVSKKLHIWSFFFSTIIFPIYYNHCSVAKLLQLCPTLCDPIDSSPPGSTIPGILQARTQEWVAISFSNPWKWSESEVAQSCPTLWDPMDCSLPGSSVHGIFQARVLEWGAIAFSDYPPSTSPFSTLLVISALPLDLASWTCLYLLLHYAWRSQLSPLHLDLGFSTPMSLCSPWAPVASWPSSSLTSLL